MKKQDLPIKQEVHIEANKAKVWKALTHLPSMKQWYFDNIPAFEPMVGFKTQFAVSSGPRSFTHLWEVVEVEPELCIAYTWRYQEYAGDSIARFSLAEDKEGTLVSFEAIFLEDFPSDIPEFKRESCETGWKYFLNDRLKKFVETSL